MDVGKMDFLTFRARDTGIKTTFGVPHSETEWERADLGDGWMRFVSGSKEFKIHPDLLEAKYRDNVFQWGAEEEIERRKRQEPIPCPQISRDGSDQRLAYCSASVSKDTIAQVREAERQLAAEAPLTEDSRGLLGPRPTEIGHSEITWEWFEGAE